jgi:hypothetical protein
MFPVAKCSLCLSTLLLAFVGAYAVAADETASTSISSSLGVYAYPAKNQSSSQQQTDEAACFAWAKTQTGYDPIASNAQASTTAPQTERQENVHTGRKIVGGAAAGAAIGAIAGDTGKGAVIGATAGALKAGHDRRVARREARAEQKAAKEEAAKAESELAAQRGNYNKAFGACLEGKGYTIK